MVCRYKHAIWDWNGTLLDDIGLCLDVINQLLQKRGGGPITQSDYQRNFKFPVIHFYDYLGFDTDEDTFSTISREFIDTYEKRWLGECQLHQDAIQTLDALSAMGLTHSILSAAHQQALEDGIAHYSLKHHFTALKGTDNIYAHGKIEQGLEWISQLDCSPEEVILIGDTLHDFEVAQAIGADCILVSRGHHSYDRLHATGGVVAKSLLEIIPLLVAANSQSNGRCN